MAEYECSACKYRFTPRSGTVPPACPYCSRRGTLAPLKRMQDLIDETLQQDEEN